MDSLPFMLSPIVLRNGIKFRRLTHHFFSPSEMLWLCREMLREHDVWAYQIISPLALSKRYHIHIDGLRFWITLYRVNSLFTEPMMCLQPPIDAVSARRIANLRGVVGRELNLFIDNELQKSENRRRKRSNRL